MKNVKKIVAFVIAAALVATGYASLDDVAGMLGEPEAKIADTTAEGEMKVTFLDVGQGDCTLIQAGGQNMVMDVGNNDQGERVVSYLKEQGIGNWITFFSAIRTQTTSEEGIMSWRTLKYRR